MRNYKQRRFNAPFMDGRIFHIKKVLLQSLYKARTERKTDIKKVLGIYLPGLSDNIAIISSAEK